MYMIADAPQSPEQMHSSAHAIRYQKTGMVSSVKDNMLANVNTQTPQDEQNKTQKR